MQLIEVFEDTGRESPGGDQVRELILLSLTMKIKLYMRCHVTSCLMIITSISIPTEFIFSKVVYL